ncbi:hypothetical protein ABKN59_004340 [Abortiporus biennis]
MSDGSLDTIDFWIDFFTTASYVSVCALTAYDYCITFGQEVQHIWKTRFNLSSVIFVVNRYATIFSVWGFTAVDLFPRTRSLEVGASFIVTLADLLSEIAVLTFFVVRTWAIWGQHFLPLVILTPLALGVATLDGIFNLAIAYEGFSPLPSPFGGCVILRTLSENVSNNMNFSFLTTSTRRYAVFEFDHHSRYIRDSVLFNVESRVAGIVVILGPVSWLRPIIVSRMILDLKSIDRISTSSLPEQHTSRFSSIMFVGNIGAPLNMTPINEIVEDEPEETEISGATITPVTLKQLSEDPLSIGLFDEQYERSSLQIAATDNAVLEQ